MQQIFKATPHSKQVMMFSATLAKEIRPVCKKFMNEVRRRAATPHPRCRLHLPSPTCPAPFCRFRTPHGTAQHKRDTTHDSSVKS